MIHIAIICSQVAFKSRLCECFSNQRDFSVIGIGTDSYGAVKLVDLHKPDVVLMDLDLPLGDCMKTAVLIKCRSPCTSVIISGDGEERRMFSVFFSGISGFITRQASCELLCHAIRTVYYGGSFVSPEFVVKFRTVATSLAGNILKSRGELRNSQFEKEKRNSEKGSAGSKVELPHTISPSEIQIMGYLGQGCTNKEIAEELHLSEGTVRNYVSSVLQKTGFRDRTQAAIYAVKAGL